MGLNDILGGDPTQRDFWANHLNAGLIGAGYAANGLLSNAAAAYYAARRNWATNDAARRQWGGLLSTTRDDIAEQDLLYAPLARAYPMTTAVGEAVPAIGAGIAAGEATLAPLAVNLVDRTLLSAARGAGFNPPGATGPLRQVLSGVNPADAINSLFSR